MQSRLSEGPTAASSPRWGRIFSALANEQFRMLWLGTLFSAAAMQADVVARSWLAYEISGSGLALGAVGLARGVSTLGCSLVAGVAADRLDKRKLLMSTQIGLGALAFANAVLVHLGAIEVWHLVLFGLLQGALFTGSWPVRAAYIPVLVDKPTIANAVALNSTAMNLNRVIGPALAGLLLTLDPALAFYAIALLYTGAALTNLRLPTARGHVEQQQGPLADLVVGFRYIWEHPVLRVLMGMALVTELLGLPFQQLLPVFQSDVLHVTPAQLGLMYSAAGIGSIGASLLIARLADHPQKGLIQVIAACAWGLSLVAFSLSTVYELSLGLLLFVGLAFQSYIVLNSVLIMLHAESRLQGRVMSIYSMTWSLSGVAMVPLGLLVDLVGAPATLAGAGAIMAVAIAVIAILQPAYRALEPGLTSRTAARS